MDLSRRHLITKHSINYHFNNIALFYVIANRLSSSVSFILTVPCKQICIVQRGRLRGSLSAVIVVTASFVFIGYQIGNICLQTSQVVSISYRFSIKSSVYLEIQSNVLNLAVMLSVPPKHVLE